MGSNTTAIEIKAPRDLFLHPLRFADLVGVVEAAGLPVGAADALRAWALASEARDWLLTAGEAKKLVRGDSRKWCGKEAA